MNYSMWTAVLTAALAIGFVGCDDDGGGSPRIPDMFQPPPDTGAGGVGGGAGGVGGVGGMGGGVGGMGGMGGVGGMEQDAAPPDMDVVDMMPDMAVDAAPAPEIDAGAACVDGDECGEWRRCVEEACRPDLRPTVYRMVDAMVAEPAEASNELQLALLVAVNTNSLNLVFEPGGYDEGGNYRFYIGNGRPGEGGVYAFRHNLPIQNFIGDWRFEDNRAEWHIDGAQPFLIDVPAGTNETPEGPMTCWTRFSTTVGMQIWPGVDEEGADRLFGFVRGFVLRSDLEQVEIRQGDNVIRFIDFIEGPPTIDSNGDGTFDAYPFELSMEAAPIDFNDPDDARDPEPPPPPACE